MSSIVHTAVFLCVVNHSSDMNRIVVMVKNDGNFAGAVVREALTAL